MVPIHVRYTIVYRTWFGIIHVQCEDEDGSQQLVEPHETNNLAAEIPGVELEEDSEVIQAVQDSPSGPNRLEQAAMALSNANLRHTATPDDEIAGVIDDENLDDPPTLVSDDDGSTDEESDGTDEESDGEMEDDEEIDYEEIDYGEGGDGGELESEAGDGEDDVEQPGDDQIPLRRSERIKKKKEPLTIDFKNRTYREKDGMIHINPSVEEWAREGTKITSEILPKTKTTNEKIAVRSPRTAGISRDALARVSLGALGLPPPTTTGDRAVVEDHVVMHILGVVLAEQYTINKGIRYSSLKRDAERSRHGLARMGAPREDIFQRKRRRPRL